MESDSSDGGGGGGGDGFPSCGSGRSLLAFTVAKMESVPIEEDRILNGKLERKTPPNLPG